MTAASVKLEPERDQLTAALAAVQAELPKVGKGNTAKVETRQGGSYTYTYANLGEVTAAILPLLGRHGLAWSCKPTMTAAGFVLVYELRHTSGQADRGTWPLPDPSRATPQEVGSAITYARRYALCCATGVAPDEDDDDAAAASTVRPTAQPKATRGQRSSSPASEPAAAADEPTKAKAERTPEQIAGARVSGMTPPALRDSPNSTKEERAELRKTRHALYALAGQAWGLNASGLGGEALSRYGNYARRLAKGDLQLVHHDGPPPSVDLVTASDGEIVARIVSDLPGDQAAVETPPDPDDARSPGSAGTDGDTGT